MKLLVLNGPNLNLLGLREPEVYGQKSYKELEEYIREVCREENVDVTIVQSNHEGCLVDRIQEAWGVFDGIVINPAAYTHTSVAILDALKGVGLPCVEIHISDVAARAIPIRSFFCLQPAGFIKWDITPSLEQMFLILFCLSVTNDIDHTLPVPYSLS